MWFPNTIYEIERSQADHSFHKPLFCRWGETKIQKLSSRKFLAASYIFGQNWKSFFFFNGAYLWAYDAKDNLIFRDFSLNEELKGQEPTFASQLHGHVRDNWGNFLKCTKKRNSQKLWNVTIMTARSVLSKDWTLEEKFFYNEDKKTYRYHFQAHGPSGHSQINW